jgi:hypothetical protein
LRKTLSWTEFFDRDWLAENGAIAGCLVAKWGGNVTGADCSRLTPDFHTTLAKKINANKSPRTTCERSRSASYDKLVHENEANHRRPWTGCA